MLTLKLHHTFSSPGTMKSKVEDELERLQRLGIIEPVQFSRWAAPIVPVLKEDKTARVCGDYKLTVNRVSKLEEYPLPRVEDLFTTLPGGKLFTKLDMSQAYQQLLLDEESKEYVTVNTHKEEHLGNLEKVLGRLSDAGLQLKRGKCVFLAPSVIYLGHKFMAEGLCPLEDKVRAIKEAPRPNSVTELRSFWGMVNY